MLLCSIYEDPDLVREMREQEAMEEAMAIAQTRAIVPAGFEGVIARLAAQRNAERPVRPVRPTLLGAARAALEAGEAIPLLVFESAANFTYNRHSDALHKLWGAKDEAGLRAYPINGTNTYARALRAYRDVLVESVVSSLNTTASEMTPMTPPRKAKKITSSTTGSSTARKARTKK